MGFEGGFFSPQRRGFVPRLGVYVGFFSYGDITKTPPHRVFSPRLGGCFLLLAGGGVSTTGQQSFKELQGLVFGTLMQTLIREQEVLGELSLGTAYCIICPQKPTVTCNGPFHFDKSSKVHFWAVMKLLVQCGIPWPAQLQTV